jgi:catechol 2,3-dioxygenase-like lactoylglutathione lyase family enzyme
MQHVVPALRVRSYAASSAFYQKLGFKETWKHQFEPGLPVFASVAREGMELFLTEHTGDCQFGGLVHFYLPDVDAWYAVLQERGVPVSQPPGNSLGPDTRDMLVVDPDGNRLSFITRTADSLPTILRRFDSPDEVREFEKGRLELVTIAGQTIGRATYQPGWRWSEHVGPGVGAPRCTTEHLGLVVAGHATAAFDDGRVFNLTAGTIFYIPPEPHDSWVVGEETYVSLHFMGAAGYAR